MQHQLVEVVGRVARLVQRLRTVQPQLGGLPQQVDDLGEATVRARVVLGLEQLGHPPPLGQDRPAGRLGGVRGEDGAYGDPLDQRGDLRRRHAGRPDAFRRLREPATLAGSLDPHLAGSVHLLGDVGQVEVGAEGAHQPGRGVQVDVLEERGEVGAALVAAHPAYLLYQVEQLGPLLADQGLAEQVAQPAYVGPKRRLRAVVGHRLFPAGFHLLDPRRAAASSALIDRDADRAGSRLDLQ